MPAPTVAVLAVAALLGGAAAGVGLERAGVLSPLDEPTAAEVRSDVVAVLDCPEGTPVATLTRGDRIVATGRSEDGAWIELRSPLGLDQRVWLPAATVAPDDGRSALDDLPEQACELQRPTTTTSSTSSTSTTSTTVPETTTTQAPPETTTTRPTRPTTTTTATTIPPDTTPPVLGTPTAQETHLVERSVTSPNSCPAGPNHPISTLISATATDDRPGVVVTMVFSAPGDGPNGQLIVSSQGANFSGTLGPFDDAARQIVGPRLVTVTVQARDAAGNVSPELKALVELFECGSAP